MNQSCAGREGLARLGCNKDLKVGYDGWAVVHGKQLACRRGSRKPSKNKLGAAKTPRLSNRRFGHDYSPESAQTT